MGYKSLILLTLALAVLVIAYATKHFTTLKDITKREAIRNFISKGLTAIGLALIVAVISMWLVNKENGEYFMENHLSRHKPDKRFVEDEIINQPFRWEDLNITARMSISENPLAKNFCHYSYSLEYTVINIDDTKHPYQIFHAITSLIEGLPQAKISYLSAYRVEGNVTLPENLVKENESVFVGSKKPNKSYWQAQTDVSEIDIPPNGRIRVSGHFEYYDHLNNSVQLFGVQYYCDRLKYEIRYDSNLFDVKVHAWPADKEVSIKDKIRSVPDPNNGILKKCEMDGTLSPWQGVVVTHEYLPAKAKLNQNNKNI